VALALSISTAPIVVLIETAGSAGSGKGARMRYGLLIYTNEADRPAWGTPDGDAEAKGYDAFYGEVTKRGVLRAGDPFLRVAEAKSVRVRDGRAHRASAKCRTVWFTGL
jgi:hypothetical protein